MKLGPALRAAAVRVAVVRAAVRAVSPAERGDHSNGQLGRRRVEHLANETVIPSEQRRREREHRGKCCVAVRRPSRVAAVRVWAGTPDHHISGTGSLFALVILSLTSLDSRYSPRLHSHEKSHEK